MVIDCIPYCGEETLLEIHLSNLNDLVDVFVVLESPRSHSQIPRELEFPKQKDRFAKFLRKIRYFPIDYCQDSNALMNDWRGRYLMQDILINELKIKPDDFIINNDLDEIVNTTKLKEILNNDKELLKPYTFLMGNRLLCFDLKHNHGGFPGTMLLKGKHLEKFNLCVWRQIRENVEIQGIKYNECNLVLNGGWHFSYTNSLDSIVNKFKFFSHANETGEWIKDKQGLINCIKTKTGFTPDKPKLEQVEWKQENYPLEIFNNKDKYKENFSDFYIS